MSKLVTVKLTSIKYSGKSVGSNFTIEVEAPGSSITFNKKLDFGKVTAANKEIGRFITDQSVIGAIVRLVERDPVFNDFGSAQVSWKVNQSNEAVTSSTCIVEVTESGAVMGKATAVFHLTFEIKALRTTRYISSSGWLEVRPDEGENFSLPTALRVRLDRFDSKREFHCHGRGEAR